MAFVLGFCAPRLRFGTVVAAIRFAAALVTAHERFLASGQVYFLELGIFCRNFLLYFASDSRPLVWVSHFFPLSFWICP